MKHLSFVLAILLAVLAFCGVLRSDVAEYVAARVQERNQIIEELLN